MLNTARAGDGGEGVGPKGAVIRNKRAERGLCQFNPVDVVDAGTAQELFYYIWNYYYHMLTEGTRATVKSTGTEYL